MSVNYTPHAVDVPITDMDDAEDDIIFQEQTRSANGNTGDDFLSSLDYEDQMNSQQDNRPFQKLRSFFFRDSHRSNQYEMLQRDRNADSFEITDEEVTPNESDEAIEPPINARDYRIKLLEKQIRNRTILGVFLILGVAIFTLLAFKNDSYADLFRSRNKQILSNSTHNFYPTTIVVSLDGFHPHYINSEDTPTLHNLMVHEYGAPYMTPSFPSSTFPNHWTLVTGLYPSEHGIVGNTFFDPKLNKPFVNTNPKFGALDPEFWQGGDPIWKTASNQGVKPAVHMWPGSEVPTIGPKDDFDRYNGSELLSSKIDRVMGWIDRDIDTRPELILTYVPTIDQFGHKYGISGSNLTGALTYVDNFVDLMQKEISARNLAHIVNLIIVSDHGMAPTSNERLLYLDDLIDLNRIEHIDGWPLFGLRPKETESVDGIYKEINDKLATLDPKLASNYHLYKVEDLPKEWQFGGKLNAHMYNYRLAPIWLIPDVGYSVTTHKQMKDNGGDYKPKGVHGYNNTHLLMRALFLGTGPYFKQRLDKGGKVLPFANTEVYNIICESLNISPSPNNGSHTGSIMKQTLPSSWEDGLIFPDLDYHVEHIVKSNATYDLLWRKNHDQIEQPAANTNNDPLKSMIEEESTISSLTTAALPKPTDFETHTEVKTPAPTPAPISVTTATATATTTTKVHENFGEIVEDVLHGVQDGIEELGNVIQDGWNNLFGGGS
ncbi:uncharacterized protein J8A68_001403 [[Candida] subhashii]|uniref:Uncharacterized protein n=1 Tax=[Candida] subhashii TaxID=561895 RepID=A0A8J5QP39_9ASCO|nr:uncharacterized protein J8A68_001403 [[Candida] subhashii]KAG7665094.1 hypothetical protein J8A68_001403 [[Candida] subhashii]